jgi:16S rRNA processing protein RimM
LQLVVGRIGRAHGVQGEATIEVRTDDPDIRFAVGQSVTLADGRSLKISANRWHNQILLLSFLGINDRDQIEELRDQLLYAEVDTNSTEPGEYHFQQLIGSQVVLPDGSNLGLVTEVVQLPGQDLLSVASQKGEVLIPMVKQIIISIDVEKKLIKINPPEGLLDVEN